VETRIISNGVIASSVLLWPILWDITVGLRKLSDQPRIAFGYFWPMVISSMDLLYVMDKRNNNDRTIDTLSRKLGNDAQSIISAAFAVGALMSTLKSVQSVHLIMYALVACLALVVPQVSIPQNTRDRSVVTSIQKASLNYALGFIIAGIGADMLSGGAHKRVYNRM
jgi:hypothetical protein